MWPSPRDRRRRRDGELTVVDEIVGVVDADGNIAIAEESPGRRGRLIRLGGFPRSISPGPGEPSPGATAVD